MQRPLQKAYIVVSNDPYEIQKMSRDAALTLFSMISTCLGPRAMQKMVITKIGTIHVVNDGNCILRELDVGHPSARCLIELSRTQDERCGDGTTSVVVLGAKLLGNIVELIDNYHPIHICGALQKAKDICIKAIESVTVVLNTDDSILDIVRASVSTKLCSIIKVPIPELAFKACKMVKTKIENFNIVESFKNLTVNENVASTENTKDDQKKISDEKTPEKYYVDIKNDIKVEKIIGDFKDSFVLDGIMIQKEIVHPQMRRNIENPRIVVFDCPLEYKKGESVTNMELHGKDDLAKALEIEEEQVRNICTKILSVKPDLVVTEKGISDLALSVLRDNNVTAIRRITKSEATRICKATGASMISRIEDLEDKHVGTAGLFESIKINNDNYCKIHKCVAPKAVSVILYGVSMEILADLERNFMDAVNTCKHVMENPSVVPGGGSTEMNCAVALENAEGSDIETATYKLCADALKTIPSILLGNSGIKNTLFVLNELKYKLSNNPYLGISISGEVKDMRGLVMEPDIVKIQVIKSAFEAVSQILRVDGIIEAKTKSN